MPRHQFFNLGYLQVWIIIMYSLLSKWSKQKIMADAMDYFVSNTRLGKLSVVEIAFNFIIYEVVAGGSLNSIPVCST